MSLRTATIRANALRCQRDAGFRNEWIADGHPATTVVVMTKADADLLAAQSERFHAFEWLRERANAGNRHAQAILKDGGVLDAIRAEALRETPAPGAEPGAENRPPAREEHADLNGGEHQFAATGTETPARGAHLALQAGRTVRLQARRARSDAPYRAEPGAEHRTPAREGHAVLNGGEHQFAATPIDENSERGQ